MNYKSRKCPEIHSKIYDFLSRINRFYGQYNDFHQYVLEYNPITDKWDFYRKRFGDNISVYNLTTNEMYYHLFGVVKGIGEAKWSIIMDKSKKRQKHEYISI